MTEMEREGNKKIGQRGIAVGYGRECAWIQELREQLAEKANAAEAAAGLALA
jgi:hypothetical protein